MSKKIFKPTEEMISMAKTVFIAMAWTETIREIVEGYEKKILEYEKYEYAEKHCERKGKTSQDWITDPKDAWLMKDQEFKHYHKRCQEEKEKAKLKVDHPDHCPLLVAENLQRQAERIFVDIMGKQFDITADKLMCAGMDQYEKFLDMSLRLLSPMVDSKSTLKMVV